MSEKLLAVGQIENLKKGGQDDVDHQTSPIRAPRSVREFVLERSGSGCDDIPTKKKKTRRGKPKRRNVHPYVKLSWQQRKNQDEMQSNKANKARAKMIAHGQALAPYNTTQFLIEDHGYLKEIEDRLTGVVENQNNRSAPSRTRDSSFSVDSDVDFYSSPEDEEEFLTKEFSNTYQDIRSERLNAMTREELMQECIQMENKVEMLTKCLSGKSGNKGENDDAHVNGLDENGVVFNVRSVQDFQLEIVKLVNENDALRRENERLRQRRRRRRQAESISTSLSSSMDSESDSSTSGSSSSDTEMETEKSVVIPNANGAVDYSKTNGFSHSPSASPAGTPRPESMTPTAEPNDNQFSN